MSKHDVAFTALNIALLTVSDSRTREQDSSGDYFQTQILGAGHSVAARAIHAAEKHALRALLMPWIMASSIDVILINGGTGYTDRDVVPEAINPLFDHAWAGFGELFRSLSYADIGSSALQTRALAGFSNGALLMAVPGSPKACALAWEKLIGPQLDSRTRPCSVVPQIRRRGAALGCS